MKPYIAPKATDLGRIAELTAMFGALSTQDTYLTANGVANAQPGIQSQFACDTGYVPAGPCIAPRP